MHKTKKCLKSFILFITVLCMSLAFSTISLAGDYATLDDFLSNNEADNVFTKELSEKKSKIEAADRILSDAEGLSISSEDWEYNGMSLLEFLFTVTSAPGIQLSHYTYSGNDFVIKTDNPYYDKLKGYVSIEDGKDFEIKNGSRYLNTTHDGLVKFINDITSETEKLKEDYAKRSIIYSGFSMIGSTGSMKTFQVNVVDNKTDDMFNPLKNKLYGSGSASSSVSVDEGAGKFERMIAEPIGEGAFKLYSWMYDWNVDLTIDGLIFGRMAKNYKGTADITHFGLEENNPYGIVAASAYYVLRRIILSILPIVLMVFLIMQLFKNTQRGRAELKMVITNIVFVIAMLFFAPYIINTMILVRDAVLKVTASGMAAIFKAVGVSDGVGSSVIGLNYATYQNNHSLLNALIWAASVGSGFVFMASYVKIAILICGCVAILPIVLLMSSWNKKIFTEWWNIFFPNLCVPLVDMILLQIPSVMLIVFKKTTGGGGGIVLGIVLITIIWNIIMIRDRVIKLLGFEGFSKNAGGMLAAAVMLMRGGVRPGPTPKPGEEKTVGKEPTGGEEYIKTERARQDSMQNTLGGISEIEDSTSSSGVGGYDPNLSDETDNFLNGMDSYYGNEVPGATEDIDMPMEMPMGEMPSESGEIGYLDEIPEVESNEYMAGSDVVEVPLEPLSDVSETMDETTVMSDTTGVVADTYTEPLHDTIGDLPDGEGSVDSAIMEPMPTLSAEVPSFKQMDIKPDTDGNAISDYEKHNYDKEFANTLSDDEQNRYSNLVHMDALHNEIENNEKFMQNVGYAGHDASRREISENQERINRINEHMERSNERLNNISDQNSSEYRSEKAVLSDLQTNKEKLIERNSQLKQAERYDRANDAYKKEISKRSQNESIYARANAVGGMSDKTYSSATDYESQMKVAQMQKNFANYENFGSKRYEGILTPAEKENFYREKEIRDMNKRLVDASLRAGGKVLDVGVRTALTTGAMALSAYGGGRAMATAAGVANLGVSGVERSGRAVVSTVKNAKNFASDYADVMSRKGERKSEAPTVNGRQVHRPGDSSSSKSVATKSEERKTKTTSASKLQKRAENAERTRTNADPRNLSNHAKEAEGNKSENNRKPHANHKNSNNNVNQISGNASKAENGFGGGNAGTLSKNADKGES